MPIIIIDRLPLPSFKTYVAVSIGLFSIALYHGLASTNDPEWKSSLLEANEDNNSLPLLSNASRNDFFTESKFRELVLFMLEDSLCFWVSFEFVNQYFLYTKLDTEGFRTMFQIIYISIQVSREILV